MGFEGIFTTQDAGQATSGLSSRVYPVESSRSSSRAYRKPPHRAAEQHFTGNRRLNGADIGPRNIHATR